MALAYACASGWKSSSSMIDEAEGRDWEKPRSKRRWRGFPWCASRLFGVMRDADYGYTTDTRAAYWASTNAPLRMPVLLPCPAVAPRGDHDEYDCDHAAIVLPASESEAPAPPPPRAHPHNSTLTRSEDDVRRACPEFIIHCSDSIVHPWRAPARVARRAERHARALWSGAPMRARTGVGGGGGGAGVCAWVTVERVYPG